MWKKIFGIIKKIVFGILLIYGYNLIAEPLEIIVPINVITVIFVSILGTPALCSLILIQLLVF